MVRRLTVMSASGLLAASLALAGCGDADDGGGPITVFAPIAWVIVAAVVFLLASLVAGMVLLVPVLLVVRAIRRRQASDPAD
jgi:hypothetical protein